MTANTDETMWKCLQSANDYLTDNYTTHDTLENFKEYIKKIKNSLINHMTMTGDYRTYTLLQTAIVTFNIDAVKILLDEGAETIVGPTEDSYFQPLAIVGRELHYSCEYDYQRESTRILIAMAKLLIEHNADPNVVSENRDDIHHLNYLVTPLGCACCKNNYELARMLIEDAHADVNLYFGYDDFKRELGTPLDIIVNTSKYEDNSKIKQLLLQHGARMSNVKDWSKKKELVKNKNMLTMFLFGAMDKSKTTNPISLINDNFILKQICDYYIDGLYVVDGHYNHVMRLYA